MRRNWLLCTCLSCALFAAPRDPFQPPVTAVCETSSAPLREWRLQGVIGREGDRRAWLVSAASPPLTITSQDAVPLTGWQLRALNRRSLTLATDPRCGQQDFTFFLQGIHNVQNHITPADERHRDGGQQGRSAAD